MILTGKTIKEKIQSNEILIEPFNEEQLNPNSYNFRLSNRLFIYEKREIDSKLDNPKKEIILPPEGMILEPDRLYLGFTEEKVGSDIFVPIMRGRSSTGRLGLFINITADLIELGTYNPIALQMHAVQPVKIYPGMLIGQITFWSVAGKVAS